MNLVKKIVLGAGILSLPLVGNSQISKKQFKEMKLKLGIEYFTQAKNLGNGYWTKNDLSTNSKLSLYNAMQTGQVHSNGKTSTMNGFSKGFLSKEELEKIDDGDYILTKEELEQGIKKEYIKAFEKYAQETLGVEKENLVNLESGYKTSSALKEKLDILTDVAHELFSSKPEEIYGLISENDAVITKEEIIAGAKAINSYLNKE